MRSIPQTDAIVRVISAEVGVTASDGVELTESPAGFVAITLNV